jgi:hypothetical protein
MTASNPTHAIGALLRKWKAEGVKIGSPNSRKRIEGFQQTHQVKLGNDFTQYLLSVNGMEPGLPHDIDKQGYRFWPLERIRSAAEVFRIQGPQVIRKLARSPAAGARLPQTRVASRATPRVMPRTQASGATEPQGPPNRPPAGRACLALE